MKQESLDKVLLSIELVLRDLDIDPVDKAELSLNLYHLLCNRREYEHRIKVLRKDQDLRKR